MSRSRPAGLKEPGPTRRRCTCTCRCRRTFLLSNMASSVLRRWFGVERHSQEVRRPQVKVSLLVLLLDSYWSTPRSAPTRERVPLPLKYASAMSACSALLQHSRRSNCLKVYSYMYIRIVLGRMYYTHMQ